MFSFRRRHQKKDSTASGGPPVIRTSPSLPELSAQAIPWPETLVDLSALPSPHPQYQVPQSPSQGAAKTSFYRPSAEEPIPFHKPFWSSYDTGTGKVASVNGKQQQQQYPSSASANGHGSGNANGNGKTNGQAQAQGAMISSLYMASHPPSAFENRKSSGAYASRPRPSQKRSRNPTTFNIMVRLPPIQSFNVPSHYFSFGSPYTSLCARNLLSRLFVESALHSLHRRVSMFE